MSTNSPNPPGPQATPQWAGIEQTVLTEGPAALRHAALWFVGIGILGSVVFAVVSGALHPAHFLFAGAFCLPAAAAFAASVTLERRSIWTIVPWTALCLMGLYIVSDPRGAAQGISPYMPTLIGAYAVAILELVLSLLSIGFLVRLWQRGVLT